MNHLRAIDVRIPAPGQLSRVSKMQFAALTLILVLTISSLAVSPVLATVYFSESFANLTGWNVNTSDTAEVELVNDGGAHATAVNMSGLWNDYSYATAKTALVYGATTTIHFNVQFMVVEIPSGASFQFYGVGLAVDNMTAPDAGVEWANDSSVVTFWNHDTSTGNHTLDIFSLSTWYDVDVYINLATGAFKWIVGDGSSYSRTVSGHTSADFIYPFFGWQYNAGSASGRYEVHLDNFTVDSASAPVSSLTVTLSADRTSALAGQGITITIAIVAGGVEVHNYIVNVTRDGVLIRTNLTASYFVETGEGMTSVVTVSGAKDLSSGTTSFTANSLTLMWSDPASEDVGPSSPTEGSTPAPSWTLPTSIAGIKLPQIEIPPFGLWSILLSLVLIAVGGILASRKRATSGPRRAPRGPQYAGRKERRREERRTRER